MADLEKLQAKIEQLRTKIAQQEEREEVIARLAQQIRAQGLTKSDIRNAFKMVDEGRGITKSRRAATRGARKQLYRHPDDPTLTWSGWARRPKWILELLDKGHTLDDLLIEKGDGNE